MNVRWVAICILITGLWSLTRPNCVPPSPLILRSCPPPSNAFTGFFRIVRRTKIFFSPAGFAVERTRILPVFVSPPPVWNQILPAARKTARQLTQRKKLMNALTVNNLQMRSTIVDKPVQ